MKAVVYYGKRDIRVEDVPEPECVPGGVKVKVHGCGICGGDLRAYLVGPDAHHPAGSLLGHEFVGDVVETGAEKEGLKGEDLRGEGKWRQEPREKNQTCRKNL